MPLTVKKMAEKVNDLTFEFAGEEVHLRYRAGIITPQWESQYKGKEGGVYAQAADLVESWDVQGDDGKPYPLDVESLQDLPVEFISAVISECAQDLVPNRKTSPRSGGSSFGE